MASTSSITRQLRRFAETARHFTPGLRRERPLIVGSMFALFASVGFTLLEPWPLKIVLDRVVPSQRPAALGGASWLDQCESHTLLWGSAALLVAITALRAAMDYYRSVGFALIGNRVTGEIRADVYRRVQSLSLGFHSKARAGDLLVRVVSDIKMLRDVAVTALLPLLASAFILTGMVAVMFLVNWQLTLLALIVVPLFGVSTIRLGGKIHEAAHKQRRREGRMAAAASEAISAVQVVQALSLEDRFEAAFSVENKRSVKDGVKTQRLSARLERTADVLIAVATAAVLGYGGQLVVRGDLTPGDLVVFLTYLKRGFRPLRDLAKYAARLAKASAAGERILELLRLTPEVADLPGAVAAPPLRGDIR
ncbi:MAG: ABC transporter ATP-binding protein, partial [Planctomycetales bacterium]|nr:ABC transporter ATP-binding protein [Planctomycetales bacterium]